MYSEQLQGLQRVGFLHQFVHNCFYLRSLLEVILCKVKEAVILKVIIKEALNY